MAKQKKKRNKAYSGADAKAERPTITRVSAANRSKLGQWWYDNKRIAKPVGIAILVAILVVILLMQLFKVAGV